MSATDGKAGGDKTRHSRLDAPAEVGRAAEELAARFLKDQGFRILRVNWRCRGGELDLVAEEGETLVFVECKSRARRDHGRPIEAVTSQKRARIVRAAALYAVAYKMADRPMRFDVVEVFTSPEQPPRCRLTRNAFVPAGTYQVL